VMLTQTRAAIQPPSSKYIHSFIHHSFTCTFIRSLFIHSFIHHSLLLQHLDLPHCKARIWPCVRRKPGILDARGEEPRAPEGQRYQEVFLEKFPGGNLDGFLSLCGPKIPSLEIRKCHSCPAPSWVCWEDPRGHCWRSLTSC
jgi:hypothetical protein